LASAGERHADRRTQDRHLHARPAADHGLGFHATVRRTSDAAHENRAERAQDDGVAAQYRRCARSTPGPPTRRFFAHGDAVIGDIGAFLAMGRYAGFVWSAYGIAFAVLGILAISSWRRYRESTVTLERLQQNLGKRR